MYLYLKDIEDYTFESSCNRNIRSKVIENDGISIVTELTNKLWCRTKNWILDKNDACVYFLMKENVVVYIGQTTRENRIKQHEVDKDFDSVRFLPLKYPYNKKIEYKLLAKYLTKYNKSYPIHNIYFQKIKEEKKKIKDIILQKEIADMYLNLNNK